MNIRQTLLASLVVPLVLTGAGVAAAQSAPKPARMQVADLDGISITRAVEIAAESVTGEIVSVEADDIDDEHVWLVMAESDTVETRLVIDRKSGAVLLTATLSAKTPEWLERGVEMMSGGDEDIMLLGETMEIMHPQGKRREHD